MAFPQRHAGLSAGFTFIELALALALLAGLALLALPSFQAVAAKRKIQTAAQGLLVDMQFARVEAIRRSRRVDICKSSDGLTCSPSLAAGWAGGWIVMAGTEILRVQGLQEGLKSGSSLLKIGFEATGLAQGSAGNISFESDSGVGLVQRVCVSLQGRARLAPLGATAC